MTVYRIGSAKYPANDGMGAVLYGGRWNQKGTPLIYTAEHISLCALEILVHGGGLGGDYIEIEIELPDSLKITRLDAADLPDGWNAPKVVQGTRQLGSDWAKDLETAVLSVPSAVIPRERNYLINPRHPDFSKIRFSRSQPFQFDPRLVRP